MYILVLFTWSASIAKLQLPSDISVVEYIPAGTWRRNNVVLTSMRRDDVALTSVRRHFEDVASTSVQRHFDVMCQVGYFYFKNRRRIMFGQSVILGHHAGVEYIWHDFTSFSTGFPSYQNDGVTFKGFNGIPLRLNRFLPPMVIQPGPEVIKNFMLSSTEHEIFPAHKC